MKSRQSWLWIASRSLLSILTLCSVGPILRADTNPIVITRQPANQMVQSNSTATFTVEVSGSVPRYQWQFNGNNISLATNQNYTIASAQIANAGAYRVIVSNPVNTVTSQVATLTVVMDTTPPELISAVAQEGTHPPYYILIRFDERLQSSTAVNNDNYVIRLVGDTNTQITVSNAQLNANLVRLTVSPWLPYGDYFVTVNNVADLVGNVIPPNSTIAIVRGQDPFVSTNALWSWSEGFDLSGQDWTSRDYDESTNNILHGGQWKIPNPAWAPMGRGIFYFYGFERPNVGPLNTVLSIGYPTYYFRTRFVMNSSTATSGVFALTQICDDGAVFYLNGAQIYRYNMPAGATGYQTLALSQRGLYYTWQSPAYILVTNLVPGTNVLAVELHPYSSLAGLERGIAFGASLLPDVRSGLSENALTSGLLAVTSEVMSSSSPSRAPLLPSGAIHPAAIASATEGISNVVHISIDGGGAYWIERFVNDTPEIFTNFHRLLAEGAGTYNARCDADDSETIPNHVCMLTGRPVLRPANMPPLQHGYTGIICSIPDDGVTIHNYANAYPPYKSSVFDVVHDHGLSTEFLSGRADRLAICERSYSARYGAPDLILPDNGPDKIDYSIVANSYADQLVTLFLQNLYFTPPK